MGKPYCLGTHKFIYTYQIPFYTDIFKKLFTAYSIYIKNIPFYHRYMDVCIKFSIHVHHVAK